MCNLYSTKASRDEVRAFFRARSDYAREIVIEKDYTAPGKPGLVVREDDGERVLDTMLWGIPVRGRPVTNVRNLSAPSWRPLLENPAMRCLVPATRFQEWSVEPDPATGKKRPYWFYLPSRPIFAFAGIWQPGVAERGSELGDEYAAPTFSFLTCGYSGSDDPAEEAAAAAAHTVGRVHPKAIPVILHDEDHDRWLQGDIDDVLPLATACPSQLIGVE